MSKLSHRKNARPLREDVPAKHLSQSISDMSAKSMHRPLREDVDENPFGISLNSLRARQPKIFIKTFGWPMDAL